VRLGVVILPEHPWAEGQELWERAEEVGFDHAWTYDHLAWRSLRDSTWFGTMPTLAAAALATTTIRLGTLVASPNVREPVGLARDVITLDDLSGGRFTLGIGAGGAGWDATMLGQPALSPAERADRLDEFVGLTDLLLREPPVDFDGWHYTAIDVPMEPGCVQTPRVPFAIAATGRRGLRLAAEHAAIWVTNGAGAFDESLSPADGAPVVAEQTSRLEAACLAVDRDPSTIDRLILLGFQLRPELESAERFRDLIGRYEAVGVTDAVVHWPRDDEPFAGDRDIFEQTIADVTGA
jgi:alkanesulfonate monooxygenase SsuD/methylene tetrahydromethanopterin reductase-like flavin-dependent oxidoreductase (luciferase family)